MVLRCLLFTEDGETAEPICQVLAGLEIEGEHCLDAPEAIEKVMQQALQILIIDWDSQPEAALLLQAARERKADERPLILAIVSEDTDVAPSLQAGANSVLRKPILVSQVTDTLTTARDLLRARQEPGMSPALRAATAGDSSANSSGAEPLSRKPAKETALRAGEFLQFPATAPGGHFVTETDMPDSFDQSVAGPVDQLKELEPVAATVGQNSKPEESQGTNSPDEPRGLEWYLKRRAGSAAAASAPAASPTAAAAAPAKVELLGFEQTPSYSSPSSSSSETLVSASPVRSGGAEPATSAEIRPGGLLSQQLNEDQTPVEQASDGESHEKPRSGPGLGKRALVAALVLAAVAVAMAPQAPWHAAMLALLSQQQNRLHAWLNPQPVAPAQAPVTHEDFGQAGDEYKLPVAENIPDATTDPSQIRVVPVIDPTAKQPNNANNPATVGQTPSDAGATNPEDATQPTGAEVPPGPQPETAPPDLPAGGGTTQPVAPPSTTSATAPSVEAPKPETTPSSKGFPGPALPLNPPQPAPVAQPHFVPVNPAIPSSLKSQMAPTTSAGGNKPVEAALPSIEPVAVAELTERGLLLEQPAIAPPASMKPQQGTVVLQLLIGRDGTVQDAKFLQGSLVFARAAIDGVKQWKFRPYLINGRAVSVQTTITVNFKPSS